MKFEHFDYSVNSVQKINDLHRFYSEALDKIDELSRFKKPGSERYFSLLKEVKHKLKFSDSLQTFCFSADDTHLRDAVINVMISYYKEKADTIMREIKKRMT